MFTFWDDAMVCQMVFGLTSFAYPALDVSPTLGLMPTIALRSAGLMTKGKISLLLRNGAIEHTRAICLSTKAESNGV